MRHWIIKHGLLFLIGLGPLTAAANDAGGGTNGVGANVGYADNGSTVTLSNGVLTATITKSSGTITSLLYRGRQMVSGNIYFSVDGGTSYENPAKGVFSVKTNTTDRVDLTFNCTLTNTHWFNVEIHYVLGRGDTGLYVYAILDHPASYPDTTVGEWRMVWKMSQDQTERIYVDNIRNWQKPSAYDLPMRSPRP
jgi:rhamnogalacturonan endolyase